MRLHTSSTTSTVITKIDLTDVGITVPLPPSSLGPSTVAPLDLLFLSPLKDDLRAQQFLDYDALKQAVCEFSCRCPTFLSANISAWFFRKKDRQLMKTTPRCCLLCFLGSPELFLLCRKCPNGCEEIKKAFFSPPRCALSSNFNHSTLVHRDSPKIRWHSRNELTDWMLCFISILLKRVLSNNTVLSKLLP